MNGVDSLEKFRKILIALDASPASQAALQLAAELAARHEAELIGIYVEDINLLRSAEIPIIHEVGGYSAISRRMNRHHIESELRAQARRVEQLLANIARRANLRWSFLSVRGLIPVELISAAENVDLIILGKKGWSAGVQIGSTARHLAALAPVQSLLMENFIHPGTPVLVIYDGSEGSQKVLRTASRICTPGSILTILIPAEDQKIAEEMFHDLEPWAAGQAFQVQFRRVPDLESQRIANLSHLLGCELVILPAESTHFRPTSISNMLENAKCAVLLVR
ncbi:MAG: universal stress protein [Anaerolineales bacterium]